MAGMRLVGQAIHYLGVGGVGLAKRCPGETPAARVSAPDPCPGNKSTPGQQAPGPPRQGARVNRFVLRGVKFAPVFLGTSRFEQVPSASMCMLV